MSESVTQPAASLKRAKVVVVAIVLALLLGGVLIFVLRGRQAAALDNDLDVHGKQYVTLVSPKAGGGGPSLTLPGTLQGFIEASVYARSNGYVVRWFKDIGATVKKGELLAEITAPEVDQELSQAIATQAQAASSEGLTKSTAERWKALRGKDAVTQQDLDERVSAYQQAQANLNAARANVARLRNLQGFNKVVAPFDGVVTSRSVDVGDLVNAGNGGVGRALFGVAQIDPLRLYVNVPQAYAPSVKVGDQVDVSLSQHSGEQFKGTIARTARAIDVTSRTMQVEIRIPNSDGKLIAGSYVQAQLPIKQDVGALIVPTNVLLFRTSGTYAAVVDDKGRVSLRLVKLGVDFGKEVAVLSGVSSNDRLVLNPADSLADGDVVTLAAVHPAPVDGKAQPVAKGD